ncbi:MAG: hypothetical protein LBE51_01665 [Acidovorax sp.]|nr:hypothetical protein [Acidovorax sp.]MDR3004782.1 hypothetical protein [Acidovorax sp.]
MNFILGYARYVLLAGLALFGFSAYLLYQSANGGGIPTQDSLTMVSGDVQEARKVTVTKKRRRGGSSQSHYYEVDLKPQDGDVLTIKLPSLVPESAVQSMADATVIEVGYDAGSDEHNAYSVSGDGQPLLPYEQMAQYMQEDADHSSEEAPTMMGLGLVLALIGGLGMRWRKQRIAREEQAQSAA